jgi:hypothetical protein
MIPRSEVLCAIMNSKHRMLAEYCCFVVVFILSGCASITGPTSYPKEWAPIDADMTADGCPNVEGTYSNHGTQAFPAELGEPPRLSDVFNRMGRGAGLLSPRESKQAWPDLPDASSVRIVQTPDLLTLYFLGRNGDQTSLQFRRYHFSWSEKRFDDLFTCYASHKEPRLRFFQEPESTRSILPNLYIGANGTLVMFLKATDGSLIVQWRNESFGISAIILGSHVSFDSVWWRYPELGDVP